MGHQEVLELKPRLTIKGYIKVMHLKKICSVCGGHLIFINFPPSNWEGSYAYFSRMGRKLCLLEVGVRTLPLLRSRHKHPPIPKPCDLHRFGS